MLAFQKITLADRDWIHAMCFSSGREGCEYSFVNLFLWSRSFVQVAALDGYLCVKITRNGVVQYLYPAGQGDIRPVLEVLWEDAHASDSPFCLRPMTAQEQQTLDTLYPGRFRFEEDRDSADYLYEITLLSELPGKKLQKKRNHIHHFEVHYPSWQVHRLTSQQLPLCRDMTEQWYQLHDNGLSFDAEQKALDSAFHHFDALHMDGVLLTDGTRVVAFSMGNQISETMFDVNFEKAFSDVPGAYSVINRAFSRMVRDNYPTVQFLNREEDMGLAGLRQAKKSYAPTRLVRKFIAREEA